MSKSALFLGKAELIKASSDIPKVSMSLYNDVGKIKPLGSIAAKVDHQFIKNVVDKLRKGELNINDIPEKSIGELARGRVQEAILTTKQKDEIKEKTGWSDRIIDAIRSKKEAEIYLKNGLTEMETNTKKCLVDPNIDFNQKDEFGRTNKERAEQGLSPITKDGQTIELHHIGQKNNSPLAELSTQEHRGKGNYSVLHDTTIESEVDRDSFIQERFEHWKSRAEGISD